MKSQSHKPARVSSNIRRELAWGTGEITYVECADLEKKKVSERRKARGRRKRKRDRQEKEEEKTRKKKR